jgi:CheY-like chemotaxis protein
MEKKLTPPADDLSVRILIVDDHPNTAELLARAISRLNGEWDVVSATSGNEALKLDDEKPADVVITDVMMSEMSGLELTEVIRSRHEDHAAVIFLMSAYSTPELMESAEYLQVKQVIRKPINPEWVCEVVLKTMKEMKQAAQPVSVSKTQDVSGMVQEA